MDYSKENQNWDSLSYVEKNHQLYLKQKALLDQFLEKGAISQAQHDKSLHDLIEKMDKKEWLGGLISFSHSVSQRSIAGSF